jgi:hypothetical protein
MTGCLTMSKSSWARIHLMMTRTMTAFLTGKKFVSELTLWLMTLMMILI